MENNSTILFLKLIVRKVFLEDWAMKLVALAITLALWFGVTGLSKPTTQRLTSIPLSLRFPNNIEVTNATPEEVDLVVTGDSRKLAQINKNDLIVSVDISDVPPGDRVIHLLPGNVAVSLPTGIRLDEVQPRSFPVRIETVEEKDVTVKASPSGEPAENFEIYAEIVTPAKVRVRGPAGFIRSLDSVMTDRVDISERTADVVARQVPVILSNPKATVVSDSVVDVVFKIGEKRIERVYSVPVNDDSGRRALVTLFGGRSLFENLRPSDIRIEVTGNETGDGGRAILPPSLEGRVEVRSVRLRG